MGCGRINERTRAEIDRVDRKTRGKQSTCGDWRISRECPSRRDIDLDATSSCS